MTDKVSAFTRSKVMRAVKSKGTGPELKVRRIMHALGYRYRVNVRDLPGKPDIAIKKRKKAIFVHGCFWHRHENCKHASMPMSNQDYWKEKFALNTSRDRYVIEQYHAMSWHTLVIWECELRDPEKLLIKLKQFLTK